ncbi:alpha/beta fold hydrolase [Vibrio sp. SM6]|uniref:Alpha/beta fold hydrolase n=1 Tax=Vibrio agarilyticus TaxID=2726741 RepID=A0A7X8TNQ8_9VIBR|nr:alpha/beta hydrolase [Vibrio agarilyticus]NLS11894.1 alpha/beta fold hydrolase [Vibrio agarilyticus]
MSEKIYFNPNQGRRLKRRLINLSTRLHHRLAPRHAKRTAQKLLLTPMKTQLRHTMPKEMVVDSVVGREGSLQTYRLGTGPVWVLTHGWSGNANQFFPLMEHIAQAGFTALAYDHPGHGQSEGKFGHIPAFVAGLEAVLAQESSIAGVVAHSMGTVSAIESSDAKLHDKPLLLIAPALDYIDNLFGSIERSGYSMRLFHAVITDIEQQFNYPLESIDPYRKLAARAAQSIIVHDEQDRFTSHAVSAKAASEMENVKLISTQGLGHGRVMSSPAVFAAFDALYTQVTSRCMVQRE